MKIIQFLFAIVVSSIIFTSCSSDDGGGNEPDGSEFVGTYNLVSVRVSAPVDLNNDGTTSNDLLLEGGCISENITLRSDFSWTGTSTDLSVFTQITGDLYNLSCSTARSSNGNWGVNGNNVILIGDKNRTFVVQDGFLVEIVGSDLPGLSSLTYQLAN